MFVAEKSGLIKVFDNLSDPTATVSPATYLTTSPGATKNDTRILPRTQ